MPRSAATVDQLGRSLGSIRLSVTDRCNLRCDYCMPEERYRWLPKDELLSFAELTRVAAVLGRLGARRLRLTGGEPLLRRDLPELVAMLHALAPDDLALTTNGLLLGDQAAALRRAGLDRITVSLDTLRADRFERITRRPGLRRVLDSIDQARAAGFDELKIDTVVVRGSNDDEVLPLLNYANRIGAELRFIEYMDVGGATRWRSEQVVSRDELLARVGAELGTPTPNEGRGSAPAERFTLPSGQVFGIVASTTAPFCRDCDRGRLTADGMWYQCLYAAEGLSLKELLRSEADDDQLSAALSRAWSSRDARGAEQRAALGERAALIPAEALRRNPHLEMHTRGG
jgi:cyclic pyranopterin phosphate synthase